MAYVLDAVILLIVLLGVWIGYRHGAVRTLIRLVGCVLALVIAGALSQPIAEGIFDGFLQEKVEQTVSENVMTTQGSLVKEDIRTALSGMPDSVMNVLDNSGWIDRAFDSFDDAVAYKQDEITHAVVTYIVRPVAVALLGIIAFLILFILLMIAVSIAAKLVAKILRLPFLRQIDGGLGAVVGALQSVLVAFVVVALLQMTAASATKDAFIDRQDIENTVLVSRMAAVNPITERWNILPEGDA